LAVASWSHSCFSKGRGRSESNLGTSHWKQISPPFPEVDGAFWGCLGRRWSGSNSSGARGNFYSTNPNPIKNPWCSQVHMNLSFRSPPLGPQVKIPEAFANRNMSSANPGSNKCRMPHATLHMHGFLKCSMEKTWVQNATWICFCIELKNFPATQLSKHLPIVVQTQFLQE